MPPKRPHISMRLDSVASQATVFFIENAVRTSNLALRAFYSLITLLLYLDTCKYINYELTNTRKKAILLTLGCGAGWLVV